MKYEPGKYEREALERERQSLHLKRRMTHRGLSQSEAQRLDAIEATIGPLDAEFLPKVNNK